MVFLLCSRVSGANSTQTQYWVHGQRSGNTCSVAGKHSLGIGYQYRCVRF